MTPEHTESQDFRAYARSVWRWKFLVLALLVVVPAASYALEARKARVYSASALVQARSVSIDPTLLGSAATAPESILTVARLVQTRTIAAAAGRLMHPPEPGGAISGLISVAPDTDTGFLTISAIAPDPQRAADVANAFARAISSNRASQTIGQIDLALAGLKRQRVSLQVGDPQRKLLNDQIQRLRTLRSTLRPDQGIVETALPSAAPVDRNTRRAIELGIVIALLLSAGAVALAEAGDRRLRSPDALEVLTGLPLLSAIPSTAFSAQVDGEVDEEAFQMLRAALTYFNLDARLASVVIASPGQEDGKTTVAIRLAYALARSGSRVILVDADLRQPRIAGRLGLPIDEGLGSVLVGRRSLSEALVDLPIRAAGPAAGHGELKLLPAGPSAPNPAELLSSDALLRVIAELEGRSDLVVIDSAAALAVSDTLPLLQAASGVVLVARLNRSTKSAVRRLQQVVAAASGTILGVVVTGASARGGYEYGYGYAPPPKRRLKRGDKTPRRGRRKKKAEVPAESQAG
ncbi:MAG TPA: AAA family ATPase [Solirubrobacteraceae bacterium]|nr:AAA family ATPase [Solirubrobacteraceae bacterium]